MVVVGIVVVVVIVVLFVSCCECNKRQHRELSDFEPSECRTAGDIIMVARHTVSSNKISLLAIIVNNKNNSKTSNKEQKRKLIEEKCYWNHP